MAFADTYAENKERVRPQGEHAKANGAKHDGVNRDEYGQGYKFETAEEIMAKGSRGEAKPWIIKGVIARGETSAWIAPPGGMKSALMAELAMCVAEGNDWHGKKHKGSLWGTVYFALERADLVRRRLRAHMQRAGWPTEDGTGDWPAVVVVPGTVDLFNPGDVPKIVATIQNANQFCAHVGLIIFDTFAKLVAAGGGDEDKARDQGRVFANIQRIKDALSYGGGPPPHIALVGHTGKDETRGSRGSNAILGDADLMVMISGTDVRTATVTKANDAPEGHLFSFKSEIHSFGLDEDGDPITVNIVSSDPIEEPKVSTAESRLTKNQQTLFAMLHDAGSAGLTLEAWNNQAREAGIGVKRKADLNDIRSALIAKGLVRQYADRWTVRHE
jgi:hypothetical protein